MNRREREVRTQEELFEILDQCTLCRLAMHDENDEIYIVPINYGYEILDDDGIRLWFHGASVGKKLSLLEKNPNVGFEMDCNIQLIKSHSVCSFSYTYMSLVGKGTVSFVDKDDYKLKYHAMQCIFLHQAKKQLPELENEKMNNIRVYYLDVKELTGKKRN